MHGGATVPLTTSDAIKASLIGCADPDRTLSAPGGTPARSASSTSAKAAGMEHASGLKDDRGRAATEQEQDAINLRGRRTPLPIPPQHEPQQAHSQAACCKLGKQNPCL